MSVQTRKLQRMFDSDSAIMLETLTRMLGEVVPGVFADVDLDRAFRAAHSIKSEAGFLGITAVADAAHALEDTLSSVRRSERRVDEKNASQLRRGLRSLGDALRTRDGGEAGRSEGSRSEGSRDEAGAGSPVDAPNETAVTRPDSGRREQAERGMLREARRRGERLFRLNVGLQGPEAMRYARGFLVVNNLELSSAVIRTEPELEALQASGSDRLTILVTTSADEESLRRSVHVDEIELFELSELSYDEVLAPPSAEKPSGGASPPEVAENQEELALLADEIIAAADGADDGRLAQIRRYANALRERLSMSARVQLLDLFRELKSTSARYAAGQGKRVRVVVGGNGARVPPAVGDTLLEAALHLLRNSIDHGIEPLDARARRGRHPAATIKVRIDRLGGRVRIVVQDDGEGIDEAAVRERAGDDESPLLDVLSRSGFTMRESADTHSGRGVGLDNVVHAVRTLLNGEMKLINKPGSGMTFVISVPAETRLIHVLVVESGSSAYAVPSATVMARQPLERRRIRRDSFGSHYYEFDGETLPLTTVTGRSITVKSLHEHSFVLIVRAGLDRRAIVADALLGDEAVVRENASRRRVYCRSLGRDVGFVFPASVGDRADDRSG